MELDLDYIDNQSIEPASELPRRISESFEVAHSLLDIIGNATYMHPSMLCLPEEAGTGEDVTEEEPTLTGVFIQEDYEKMWQRVSAAKNSLYGSTNSVKQDLIDAATPGLMCDALDRANKFGIQGTIPASSIGDALLENRVKNTLTEVIKQEKKTENILETLTVPPDDPEDDKPYKDFDFDRGIQKLCEAMKEIFGGSFSVLPTFKIPNNDEFLKAFNADITGTSNSDRIWLWLQQAAETHPSLRRFETAAMMADAWRSNPVNQVMASDQGADILFSINQPLTLHVTQLPYRENDNWIALSKDEISNNQDEEQDFKDPPEGYLSIVIHAPDSLNPEKHIGGILIDQWEERIPNNEVVTGLTFNYDQPNSQAPQTMLLAVPSHWHVEKKDNWRISDLFETVLDTMDLMKIRTVDLDALREVGHFLPALYLSPDLPELKKRDRRRMDIKPA